VILITVSPQDRVLFAKMPGLQPVCFEFDQLTITLIKRLAGPEGCFRSTSNRAGGNRRSLPVIKGGPSSDYIERAKQRKRSN